jgi:hypothetical protein
LTQSLGPHALDKHRARIGVEVEIILHGYWKDQPAQIVKDGILADWMDNLQDWHADQIKAALVEWRNENPSKRPNPGHILKILKRRRGQVFAARSADRDPIFAIDRSSTQAIEAAHG